jgi:hypothetical protein
MPRTPVWKKTARPMTRTPLESLRRRAAWHPPLRRMLENGYPLTKAVWLWEANEGEPPEFPLRPERIAEIPRELEGEVPRTEEEFYDLVAAALSVLKPVRRRQP